MYVPCVYFVAIMYLISDVCLFVMWCLSNTSKVFPMRLIDLLYLSSISFVCTYIFDTWLVRASYAVPYLRKWELLQMIPICRLLYRSMCPPFWPLSQPNVFRDTHKPSCSPGTASRPTSHAYSSAVVLYDGSCSTHSTDSSCRWFQIDFKPTGTRSFSSVWNMNLCTKG